jgi:hypothetical protein
VNDSSNKKVMLDAAAFAVMGALGAGVYFLGVGPTRSAAQAAVDQRARYQTHQQELGDAEALLNKSKEKLADLRKKAVTARKVGAESTNERIRTISEIASRHSVNITELTPKPEVPGHRFKRTPIAVAGSGPASSFAEVFAALHTAFPDTEVAALSITGAPERSSGLATFRAELVWYALADLPNQAAPAGRAAGTGN